MKLLQNKIALITGASRGIGRAIATTFAEQGASVAFTYLSSVEKGQALEDELKALGVNAKGYRSDASDYKQAEDLVATVLADFGTIDILVNNAGITKDGLLMRMTEEQWDTVIQVNLKSVIRIHSIKNRIYVQVKLKMALILLLIFFHALQCMMILMAGTAIRI